MRRLVQREVAVRAVSAGVLLTLACVPYLHSASPDPALFRLRAVFLCPVAIILFQVTFAWTHLAGGRSYVGWRARLRGALPWALATVTAATYAALFLDRSLAELFPGYFPGSFRELLIELPWTAGFQVLAFVTAVYAFAVRFWPRPWVGMVAVVLARQALLRAQVGGQLPPGLAFHVEVFAGLVAWLLVAAYRDQGFLGAAAVSTVFSLRLLVQGF
ncbi:MAG: hypothetical protein GXP31_04760 [Kiritimatiellaeota bacterium]|nr:hypothetical protein [Kiritimatiellota bacterium]